MACVEGGRHDLSSQPRGWSQAHIFGAALSRVIAQRIALRHPGRALSVTSAMSLPSDGSRIGAGRLMRFGLLAKLAPTKLLVLHGDKDPILRVSAARATAIDGARLVILPGVGHDLPATLWPVIADEVRQNADRAHAPAN